VLHPKAVMAVVTGVLQALRPETRAATVVSLRAELQQLDRKIEALIEAIETGGPLTSLVDTLKVRQARRDEILATIAARQTFDGSRFEKRKSRRRFASICNPGARC
jgi:hypothetical protein